MNKYLQMKHYYSSYLRKVSFTEIGFSNGKIKINQYINHIISIFSLSTRFKITSIKLPIHMEAIRPQNNSGLLVIT